MYYSVKAEGDNIRVYVTDVVPISNIVECIKFAETELQDTGLKAPMVGHVGDGNFHVSVVYDPTKENQCKYIRAFSNKLIDKALKWTELLLVNMELVFKKKNIY